jgi:benzodiazapine receptor
MKISDIPRLILSILICQLAGYIGSPFSTAAIPTWYKTLNKPSFIPAQLEIWSGLD